MTYKPGNLYLTSMRESRNEDEIRKLAEEENKQFIAAMEKANQEMIRFKRYKNSVVVTMENGEIVKRDPWSYTLPEDESK